MPQFDNELTNLLAAADGGSIRLQKELANGQIVTMQQLLAHTRVELRCIGLGRKCLDQLEQILAQRGLYLAGVFPEWWRNALDEMT